MIMVILCPDWATRVIGCSAPSKNGRGSMLSPDIKYLLFAVILTFVQMLVAAMGANQQVGLPTLAGNRDGLPEMTGWAGRARRAHLNMLENMVLFTALVLIAQIAGKANAMTALGA